MKTIAFIDTEIDPQSGKVLDLGGISHNHNIFHKVSPNEFIEFVKGSEFICGHNILNHDVKYIGNLLNQAKIDFSNIIDTLYLSPLLFPSKPYHALVKDDKLQYDEANNPLNDAIKAKDLFYDEIDIFKRLDEKLKDIYFYLLNKEVHFKAFFRYIDYQPRASSPEVIIQHVFKEKICLNASLGNLLLNYPVELAYCLSLINADNRASILPRWVLKNCPGVEQVMFQLKNNPCIDGCSYCDKALDAHHGLSKFFGFDSYRIYDGQQLQLKAVQAAINNKSFLVVFPTGGGKSITFQVPALMRGEATRSLTVIISPLQSLMKDQVDNLEKRGITDAVTINGLLDPIERAKSFERIEDGSACILYISPESLRSPTIERLLLGRNIARFVIDEAHCFSSWGQDFRVDYIYIGEFIRLIQEKKNLSEPIPLSCFTATAKPKVIEDICDYFKQKLDLELQLFTSSASRTNLHYKVMPKGDEEEKYQAARDIIDDKNSPTIIYVSRTKKATSLAQRLIKDGYNARAYHGKLDSSEKTANQNAFLSGEVDIMVATSAFGMGVDKKDIGVVIHHDISDSLENYVQEAGRAGRDEHISADCYVLYNEEDLSKHFILLNQTKLSIKEIQQIWKAIKEITRFRSKVSNSALEIARKAGWDDTVAEIETRVTTAIAALEDTGYIKRGQNSPRVFANSILARNAQEAIEKIILSERFTEKQKEKATRIIKKLFSSKSRKQASDEAAESRVDYISDHLGIVREEVINIINLLREENILADAKDLTAFIKQGENKNKSLSILETFSKTEKCLLNYVDETPKKFQIKELNSYAENDGCNDITPNKVRTIVNYWAIKNWIRRKKSLSKNHFDICTTQSTVSLKEKINERYELAKFITSYLFGKVNNAIPELGNKEELLVEFSIHELKNAYETTNELFQYKIDIDDVEDALFYLSKIEAIKIEGGFLVIYNRLTVERLETDNKKRYTSDDYQKLNQFYGNKVQQIHIVGEYAKKMIENYKEALQFVEDYFQLNYTSFLNKYFKGDRQNEIKQNLTPTKFRELYGELSPQQLNIVKDSSSKYMVVAAGPGSGKTKILVHKLASLLLVEDVKHEQLLMLTFSRAAATEFKKRLLKLIGNAANYIEIKTFHSYCFDLLGKVGSLEKSADIVKHTVQKIRNKEVEANRITKTVLVIDEAQDIDKDEFDLISTLMEENEEMRVIAVGDDDQNIYQFRGANSKHLKLLIEENGAQKYELIENYRSKSNLVNFSNQFAASINNRLKTRPILAKQPDNGGIKIFQYTNGNLIMPLVENIVNSSLKGTTCILTKTNEEALYISGLLLKNNIQAKLIQSNEGFNLYNLLEVRIFLELLNIDAQAYVIDDEIWEEAKRIFKARLKHSANFPVIENLIKDFEKTNTKKKYRSDFEVFIRESKLEDFYIREGETIFVSTIHKAKGKEFDNIFLVLENVKNYSDEEKRLIYVAITRAKQNLTIHHNTNYFKNIHTIGLERTDCLETNPQVTQLALQLFLKDVWLDYFLQTQENVSKLTAGDNLIINRNQCFDSKNQPVLKFSKSAAELINDFVTKGYDLKNAIIDFIVYWKGDDMKKEIRIVLPKLYFEKQT